MVWTEQKYIHWSEFKQPTRFLMAPKVSKNRRLRQAGASGSVFRFTKSFNVVKRLIDKGLSDRFFVFFLLTLVESLGGYTVDCFADNLKH